MNYGELAWIIILYNVIICQFTCVLKIFAILFYFVMLSSSNFNICARCSGTITPCFPSQCLITHAFHVLSAKVRIRTFACTIDKIWIMCVFIYICIYIHMLTAFVLLAFAHSIRAYYYYHHHRVRCTVVSQDPTRPLARSIVHIDRLSSRARTDNTWRRTMTGAYPNRLSGGRVSTRPGYTHPRRR